MGCEVLAVELVVVGVCVVAETLPVGRLHVEAVEEDALPLLSVQGKIPSDSSGFKSAPWS